MNVDDFISRWSASGGSERANFQQFAIELTQVLGVPAPKPATADAQNDDYRFERPVTFIHTGTQSRGFIDLYRRAAFVMEAKQGTDAAPDEIQLDLLSGAPVVQRQGHGLRGSRRWDDTMLRARNQADGYLQWHFRTHGTATPAEPVLRDFRNIENRDAVLSWDGTRPRMDNAGQPVTRWDGVSTVHHPVTGEPVPDPAARVQVLDYLKPRPATWPDAEFIVGNPPFIGDKRMREALGDGYAEALRAVYPKMPESADFVMFWWEKAALAVRAGKTRRSSGPWWLAGGSDTETIRATTSRAASTPSPSLMPPRPRRPACAPWARNWTRIARRSRPRIPG